MMKIGFGKVSLDPKFPAQLVGYAPGRDANDTLNEIYVKLILFEENNNRHVLINYDVLGYDELLLTPLYERLNEFDITSENVFTCATHTHSSQGGVIDVVDGVISGSGYILGHIDLDWQKILIEKTIVALEESIVNLSQGEIKYSKGKITDVGSNRNDQTLPGDDALIVFEIINEEDIVVMYNYACHPTILKIDNIKVSSDFPGIVDSAFIDKGYKFAFFMNGSAGDISTRFTRKGDDVSELNRLSNIIISGIEEALSTGVTIEPTISIEWLDINLLTKIADSKEEAERKIEEYRKQLDAGNSNNLTIAEKRTLESYVEGAKANLEFANNYKGITSKDLKIGILKINRFNFVGVPGELYSELSNPIKTDEVNFVSYANGYFGYFVNANAFDKNYYEAQSSPYRYGEAEKMMKIIEAKIK